MVESWEGIDTEHRVLVHLSHSEVGFNHVTCFGCYKPWLQDASSVSVFFLSTSAITGTGHDETSSEMAMEQGSFSPEVQLYSADLQLSSDPEA